MAEEDESGDDSKTEEPTSRKLEEARKRGQVVQSREVTSWAMLLAITLLVMTMAPTIMANLRDLFKEFIIGSYAIPMDPHGLTHVIRDLLLSVLAQMALPFMVLMLVAIGINLAQTGPMLTAEPLKPDFSKISIMKGFGRLFSMRSIVELIKGIAKMLVASAAGYIAMQPYFHGVEHFAGQDVYQALSDMEVMFLKLMISSLIVLFVIAAGDYIYQRHSFMQQMRMSKHEIKEEFKQTEGDPMVKAKLRQMREQKARQRMMQAVPTADVVITNPTHYAVALKYDGNKMNAPVLVAKGADLIAQKIKEVAKENKVTIVENAPLARSLYDSMDIDQAIPAEHYKAVAEVISYVFRLKGKR